MESLKKVWNWLVYSSADPTRYSATIRGALLSVVPIVIAVGKMADLSLNNEDLENLIEGIVIVIQCVLGLIAACVFAFGIVRKIWLTIKGDHATR